MSAKQAQLMAQLAFVLHGTAVVVAPHDTLTASRLAAKGFVYQLHVYQFVNQRPLS